MAKSVAATHKLLPGPIELAKEAWEIYKKRVFTVLGIGVVQFLLSFLTLLVGVVLGVILFFALGGKPELPIFIVGGVLVLLVTAAIIYLSVWFLPAYPIAYRDWQKTSGLMEIIKSSRTYMRATFLTGLLSSVLVLGASFVFVIPGIAFRVFFMFWIFVMLVDNRSGLSALHTSREYVRGRFWGVVGRVIAVHIPEFVLSILISGTVSDSMKSGGGFGMQLVSIALLPFYGAYMYTLFVHLKKVRGEVPARVPDESKRKYFLVAGLGYILLLLGIFFVVPRVAPLLTDAMNQFAKSSAAGKYPAEYNQIQQVPSSYQDVSPSGASEI